MDQFKSFSYKSWRLDITEEEKVANFTANSHEETFLRERFSNFDNKTTGGFNGVSDILYITCLEKKLCVFIVQASGANPRFNGGSWGLPGGLNDKDSPALACIREGEEESAGTFSGPQTQEDTIDYLSHVRMFHYPHPSTRWHPDQPVSFGIIRVNPHLDWTVFQHNFNLAKTGYDTDMSTPDNKPQPRHEKQGGAWVCMEDLIAMCSEGMPSFNAQVSLRTYDPKTKTLKPQDFILRANGIYLPLSQDDLKTFLQHSLT